MNQQNNGGPAFPCEVGPESGGYTIQTGQQQWMQPGMNLLDYFAIRATEEDILRFSFKGYKDQKVVEDDNGYKRVITQEAMRTREEARYAFAKAMLQARNSQ